MSCQNYKIIFNDETNYVAQDISEEPVVRVIPVKGEQGETGPKGEDGKNFEPTIVSELPATGDESKIYLTPKAHTSQTATGNPIEATVAEQAGKLESFQLDGDTFQQSYSGSNLLNAVPATSGYLNGLSATIENDGSIHLTGVSTANYSNFLATQVKTLAAGNYVFSVDKKLPFKINLRVFYSDSTNETFYRESELDLPISLAKQVTSFYIYAGSTISGTTYDETFKVWLSSGATATSYEPFVGGQPSPSPDYPQQIQTVTGEQTVEIVGKNLFDGTWRKGQYDNGVWHSDAFDGERATTNLIPVTGGDYSISLNSDALYTSFININYFDADKTWLGNRTTLGLDAFSETDRTKSFTLPDTAYYLAVSIRPYHGYSGQTVYANAPSQMLQVERSSTNTPYVTYSKQTLPINLGKNLFDKDNAVILTGELNADKTYSTDAGKTIYIKCKPNTTYSVQKADIGKRARLGTSTGYLPNGGTATNYAAMGTVVSGVRYGRITTGQNDRYLWFTFAKSDDAEEIITRTINSIQIEAGAQYSSYAPYKTPIELCKLGTYQDYIWKDGEDWKLHKAIGKYVFTGEEASTWDSTIPRIYLSSGQLSDINIHPVFPENANTLPFAVTNKFSIKTFASFYTSKESNGFAMSTQGKNFNFGDKSWTQKSDGQAGINGAIVYYALETATDTTITDTTLISQFEAIKTASLENGTSTIMNSTPSPNLTGDMEISYYSYNPRNRYDKWLWLDINNEYEQLNNPDTTPSLSSTRNLNLTNIQSDLNEINNDEEQEDVTFNDAEEEER